MHKNEQQMETNKDALMSEIIFFHFEFSVKGMISFLINCIFQQNNI